MPEPQSEQSPIDGLWNTLTSLTGKVEGGIERLWERLKAGEERVDPEHRMLRPTEVARGTARVAGRAAGIIGQEAGAIGRGLYEAGPGALERVRKGEIEPGSPEMSEAARNFAFTWGILGTPTRLPAGALRSGLGPKGEFKRFSDRFTDEQINKMMPDAVQSGIVPKGSRREDLRKAIDEMAESRAAAQAKDVTPEAPKPAEPEEGKPVEPEAAGAGVPPRSTLRVAPEAEPPAVPGRELAPLPGGGAVGPPREPPPGLPPRPPTEPEGGMPSSRTEEPPEVPGGPVKESPEMIRDRLDAMNMVHNELFSAHTQAASDRLKFTQDYRTALTTLTPNEKLNIERNLEWQPGMRQAPVLTPRAQRILDDIIKPSQARALRDWKYLQQNADIDPELLLRFQENEGYMHRIVVSPRRPIGNQPFAPFQGVRSLRQRAASQQRRQYHVLQNARGDRVFAMGRPPAAYGSKHLDQAGREWEVRRATSEEVEAKTDTRYLHDPVLSTLHNEMQLRIARRNVGMLKDRILPELDRRGLATSNVQASRRMGFEPSIVPALRGWYFTPRVARAFDDFYRSPALFQPTEGGGDLGLFGALNRLAINIMFINPFPHMMNVLSDYAVARSGLWGTRGDGTLAPFIRQAFTDVWNKTPFYHQVLKQGGALMGADASNTVAFGALMNKLRLDMMRDPQIARIAKETGVWETSRSWAQDMWLQSQNMMWGFHDIMMIAQTRALMAQGRTFPQAVHEAERFIANYRVPASIGEGGKIKLSPTVGRTLSRLAQDRTLVVFGRYHYNKFKLIANVLRDGTAALTRAGLTSQQRHEALSRLAYMLIMSLIIVPTVNVGLQWLANNPEARFHMPGAMGTPVNLTYVINDMIQQNGEAWWDFTMALMSIVTPMPFLYEVAHQVWGSWGPHLPAWKQWLERGVSIAETMAPPLRDIHQLARSRNLPEALLHGVGAMVGPHVSLPDPQLKARARRPPKPWQRRFEERQFERRVPFLGR